MTNIQKIRDKAKSTLASWLETGTKEYPQTEQEAIEHLQELSNKFIPKRYVDISCDELDEVFEFVDSKTGYLLYGDCGTGKTRKAYAIAKLLKINKFKVKVINILDYLDEVKETFSMGVYKEKSVLDSTLDYDVIIIDDLGVEKSTEWVMEAVYKLINSIYLDVKKVYITTNLDLNSIASKYGDRIASRIVEMCTIKQLVGEDKRIK